ncbi:CBS domain-containing protein [Coprinopsis sp. MPI-PUGE-AT-0042]|nr:CBS domain-containing protein [Coprinopsis sp. MPI-PUGE-AT-0042]
MPPTIAFSGPPPSRLYLFRGTFTLFSVGIQLCTRLVRQVLVFLFGGNTNSRSIPSHAKREFVHLTTSVERRATPIDSHHPHFVLFIILIPVLVLLSGLFAGLTLGYMSLDETQLYVLSVGGTAEQRTYANEIIPLRKNGHRLLVTLLLANMIVNESLPVIADPVLGGGVQGVAVSTVLIVIFAEIIPQSLFSRHGLYLGAKMAGLTRCLMFALAIIAWPVAKLLDIVIGHHRGLIYRHNGQPFNPSSMREPDGDGYSELKELIALHSANETQGGDLCQNAVKLVGAALDLQHKVVKEIMTDIKDVFMLSIESKLDDETLKVIHERGQSKIPVYEEIELSTSASVSTNGSDIPSETVGATKNCRVKRITDVLLMKDCVLLDRRDAIPIYNMPLVKPIFVSGDEPLFGLLDAFRESRSHMAIVTRPIGRTVNSLPRLPFGILNQTL